ncbi:hypothetical protein [Streptomyces tanashiensis]|uniref:hypothetical protein n=1 Tax=Streptomyces tanashiensis TaxID=67367 RepID=UPI00341B0933
MRVDVVVEVRVDVAVEGSYGETGSCADVAVVGSYGETGSRADVAVEVPAWRNRFAFRPPSSPRLVP